MTLARIILIFLIFTGCRSEYDCPPPSSVRLKRMSAHRMKYAKFQMHERAMARERNAELNKQRKHVEREVKNMNEVKPTDFNEWDCPKPETAHQRQILKARKKREKQNEEYVRKRLEKQEIVIPKNYEEASKTKSDKEDK